MVRSCLFVAIVSLCFSSLGLAQEGQANAEIGERLVVTAPRETKLKVGTRVVETVSKGNIVTVREKAGDWYWVMFKGKKGWLYHSEVKSLDAAIDHFSNELRFNTSSDLLNIRGLCYNAKGDYPKAIEDFSRAIRSNSSRADLYNNRGNAYQKNGELDQAYNDFSSAIKYEPYLAVAHQNRGYVEQLRGNYDSALQNYDQAIKFQSNFTVAHMNRAEIYRLKREYEKAIADYTQLMTFSPANPQALLNRGKSYSQLQKFDAALKDFNQIIELTEKNKRFPFFRAEAFNGRGNIQLSKEKIEDALGDYSTAIEINPRYEYAYNNRANTWLILGEFKNAVADFDKALELNPNSGVTFTNRGVAWNQTGEYDKALADFDAALKLDPKDAFAHLSRAWLLATCPQAEIRNGEQAVASANTALELIPDRQANDYSTLAAAYAESGNFADAIKWQNEAIKIALAFELADQKSRLELFESNEPYRDVIEKEVPLPLEEPE